MKETNPKITITPRELSPAPASEEKPERIVFVPFQAGKETDPSAEALALPEPGLPEAPPLSTLVLISFVPFVNAWYWARLALQHPALGRIGWTMTGGLGAVSILLFTVCLSLVFRAKGPDPSLTPNRAQNEARSDTPKPASHEERSETPKPAKNPERTETPKTAKSDERSEPPKTAKSDGPPELPKTANSDERPEVPKTTKSDERPEPPKTAKSDERPEIPKKREEAGLAENWTERLAANLGKSVVVIETASGFGTAFVVASDKDHHLFLTNRHVLGWKGSHRLKEVTLGMPCQIKLRDKSKHDAVVVGLPRAEGLDLALLEAHVPGLKPLGPVLDFSDVKQGERVAAVGHPLGFDFSITDGIVSGMREDKYIQTTAPINSGSSGGPLVNAQGGILGVCTLLVVNPRAGQALGMALRADSVRDPRQWRLQGGEAERLLAIIRR